MKETHNKLFNTYILSALWDGRVSRWDKSVINVYINDSQIGPFLDKLEIKKRLKKCFDVWETALQGKIHFNYIDKHSDATDIYIDFQRNNFNGTTGQCQMTRDVETSVMTKAYITLGLIWTQYFDQNTIHEIGHALGIANHSPDNTDIMYKSMIVYGMKLSVKDTNTIRMLYELPIGCDYSYINSHFNEILTNCLKQDESFNTTEDSSVSKQINYNIQNSNKIKDLSEELAQIAQINILKYNQNLICYSYDIEKYISKIRYNKYAV